MSTYLLPTNRDLSLAYALGNLAQASAHLESALVFALQRLLPITTPMAEAMFGGNQISRNVQTIEALLALRDIPMANDTRLAMIDLMKKVTEQSIHRNRILHGAMVRETVGPDGLPKTPEFYYLSAPRSPGTGFKVTVEMINRISSETQALIYQIMFRTPVPTYDFSQWERSTKSLAVKEYPEKQIRTPRVTKAERKAAKPKRATDAPST